MKRNLFLFIIGLVAAFSIGCSNSSADLQFINSDSSPDNINDIVWAGGNQTWNSGAGYPNDGVTATGSKEVTELSGEVECTLSDGVGGWDVATVDLNGSGSPVLELDDGSSNTYTIEAN